MKYLKNGKRFYSHSKEMAELNQVVAVENFIPLEKTKKGHHRIMLSEEKSSDARYFIKYKGPLPTHRFLAEKEVVASRMLYHILGPNHVPFVQLAINEAGEYHVASREIKGYTDLEDLNAKPFFLGEKGETRVRLPDGKSVAIFGRIATKFALYFLGESDPMRQNRGVSCIPNIHGRSFPLLAGEIPCPIITIDHELCLAPSTIEFSDAPALASRIAGKEGIISICDELNLHDLAIQRRKAVKEEIVSKIAAIPFEHLRDYFDHGFSKDYTSEIKQEINTMFCDLIERQEAFIQAAELMNVKKIRFER